MSTTGYFLCIPPVTWVGLQENTLYYWQFDNINKVSDVYDGLHLRLLQQREQKHYGKA
ncbi:MAG: hypothetical protein V7K15_07625 [Nostoc sp.]